MRAVYTDTAELPTPGQAIGNTVASRDRNLFPFSKRGKERESSEYSIVGKTHWVQID